MIDLAARLAWTAATVVDIRPENASVKTIAFRFPGWKGHVAGQHVDIRLTAADGYVAQRSYSLASAAGEADILELTVQAVRDGEVSSFLLESLEIGDFIEIRGPIGGYFTWTPDRTFPLVLVGGGSGVVPLMSMLRTRAAGAARQRARLLYSSRTRDQIIYTEELERLSGRNEGPEVVHTLTREQPPGWSGEAGRIGLELLARYVFAASEEPDIFVCGPTPFVETITAGLVGLGHGEAKIWTERFGPTGGG